MPVGTTARLAARLRAVAPHSEIAWNPEFLREGFAVADTMRPERIVVGVESERAEAALREIYAPMLISGVPFFSTDPATAELVKVASNSFLATKISFINAMAEVCDAAGADVVMLADAVGPTRASATGSSIPAWASAAAASPRTSGPSRRAPRRWEPARRPPSSTRSTRSTPGSGDARSTVASDLVGGSFAGRRVAVLGAAFKPGSDDVRDSPALDVASAIRREGAEVRVHDPEAIDNARAGSPNCSTP